jgi:hypothetical protein
VNTPPQMRVPLFEKSTVRDQQAAQAAQAMAQQVFLGIYIPLLVQLTTYRAMHGYSDGEAIGLAEPSTPERVAEEAWKQADAAMKRLGFSQTRPTETGI